MGDLHRRFIERVLERPGLLFQGDSLEDHELWALVGEGLLTATADHYCDNGHHFWSEPTEAPVETRTGCSMCEQESSDPDEHCVRYKFMPVITRAPAVSPAVDGLLSVKERAQAFARAYPPDLFDHLTNEEFAAIPQRWRTGTWIRAIEHATGHILAAEGVPLHEQRAIAARLEQP